MTMPDDTLRDQFYQMTTQPTQSSCQVFKRVGGQWYNYCGYLDGEKLLCMDGLYKSVMKKECLIYSFGLGKKKEVWSSFISSTYVHIL